MPVVCELDAAMPGTEPRLGVGLLTITPDAGVCANDDCVATDEAEFVLVGLAGRTTLVIGMPLAPGATGFDRARVDWIEVDCKTVPSLMDKR